MPPRDGCADWVRGKHPVAPPRRSRADGLTAEVFQREYLSKGRPVLITDAADGWPARAWNYSSFAQAAAALSYPGELSPWNMAIDEADVSPSRPLTLARYPALLPRYPNLYIAWTNRRFSDDSLLVRSVWAVFAANCWRSAHLVSVSRRHSVQLIGHL